VDPRTGLDVMEKRKMFPLPGIKPRPSLYLLSIPAVLARGTEEKLRNPGDLTEVLN
jgi:hypothetical protein